MVANEKDAALKSDNPSVKKVPAVTRAIAILRLLARSKEPLGVNRIARELNLVPSTVLHILRVLMAEEFVSFDENTKRYELDIGILTLAGSAVRRNSFIKAVQPGLDHISNKFGMTILAAKLSGLEHSVVVAVSVSSQPFRLSTEVGSRFPALISASGRCVAAFGDYKKSELERGFKKLKWAKPPAFNEWLDQVAEARELGYGVDDGNYLAGVAVVAVPFLEDGVVTHSIAAVGLQEQFVEPGFRGVAAELQSLVHEVSGNYR